MTVKTTLCYAEHDGKYLMLYRNKKNNDMNEGKWIGIGGHFEPGETADECMLREFREETGLVLTEYKRRGIVHFCSETDNEDMYLYTATGFEGEMTEKCNEGELKWIPVEEVTTLPIWEGDGYFLKALTDGRNNIEMTLVYKGGRLVGVTDIDN